MLRLRIVLWGITLLTCAGWLFSQEIDPPDLASAVKNIEALRQLQIDIESCMARLRSFRKPAARRMTDGQPLRRPRQRRRHGSWHGKPMSAAGALKT